MILRFDRDPAVGFANPLSFSQGDSLELINQDGQFTPVPWSDIKLVYFVRDYPIGRMALERMAFRNRPKAEGLWVRVQFRDQETLEGVLSNNLLQMDGAGFTIVPPEMPNVQRVYIPRIAIHSMVVLGVIAGPLGKQKKPKAPTGQIGLFEPQ